jgi:hypothetical protein
MLIFLPVFQHYMATEADLRAIEAGIGACWQDELKTIFVHKEMLARPLVVSYDGQYVYLWIADEAPHEKIQAHLIPCHQAGYRAYKVTHNLKISDKILSYWRAGLLPKRLRPIVRKVLGKTPDSPMVSGGLLTPFVTLQRHKRQPLNPYVTLDSYKATIVHELAHKYFDQHRLWWSSSHHKNLRYLKTALALYKGKRQTALPRLPLHIPNYGLRQTLLSETFAFCAEYTAARKLWPNHQAALDQSNALWISNLMVQEKKADLDRDSSALDVLPGHTFAVVVGRLLLEQSPRNWVKRLLASTTLC